MDNNNNKITNILLTGASGFIGSHVLEKLVEHNYTVTIITRNSTNTWRINHLINSVTVHNLDKNSLDELFSANPFDAVVHLAAKYIKNHSGLKDIEELATSNIHFPAILCEMCKIYKVPYFINTGTFFEYKQQNKPLTEKSKKDPYDFYAATKRAFTNILQFYTSSKSLTAIELVLGPVFGERDNEKLFAFLCKVYRENLQVDMSGGEQKWNFTYVKDTANAYIKALQKIEGINSYEHIHIGSKRVRSIKSIAKTLKKISKNNPAINWGARPYIPNEIFYAKCYSTKAKQLLDWEATTSFENALTNTYKYFEQGGNND